ncbi:hypothetical protein SAMN05443551_0828 [Marivita hallyeonensis]|uniref:Uncharacterized protein n=1 Tax=Marivita hallyeonensis TaxID=996342 RepID=A0A1M5N9Z5_9RHOB|nr:hypothetical protein SAMN05443551_0828 [Marivita hallyeonensis]
MSRNKPVSLRPWPVENLHISEKKKQGCLVPSCSCTFSQYVCMTGGAG